MKQFIGTSRMITHGVSGMRMTMGLSWAGRRAPQAGETVIPLTEVGKSIEIGVEYKEKDRRHQMNGGYDLYDTQRGLLGYDAGICI